MDKENLNYVGKNLLLVVVGLMIAILVFAIGLIVGYGVIGDGDNMFAILSPEKWQELFSKFTGK
ncbi:MULTISPECIES: DNA-directed RNA polymerase subunit beta [Streptococcus]|uniref:DNA-directed RNA polymerase subunit beta n=1 Tax=Streptococcus ruminantium TaxID=1917441 RepID=A0A2Z5U349_9STRE|nr:MULTISPECIES: DNA-directed RNA polymerase subunit beta [Streptococcus]MDQ8758980.1 DNA-directed RNA polymerase subunit beta [Streptococcus ruminantium]MDQ8765255.1 DNA-directed RNA polymerase subunit beta [Streptococcus ruminantium]MDQ8767526.1 DNA-directed RNA polymerase subunit beta [Streptococcus ruminantium]MDQ8769106.1 DNA-directed RNA polymerase subunit beta [Streptococcus ruminantium]MDQ8775362.1 DNA-directed RNA polymerase subunit beta [Streptococcus ruminantium]